MVDISKLLIPNHPHVCFDHINIYNISIQITYGNILQTTEALTLYMEENEVRDLVILFCSIN